MHLRERATRYNKPVSPHYDEFEPVVRPTMESKYPLLEIEEVVAGDDEGGCSSFCGVSHPPGSDDMDLITTVCAYYQ
ncbi:hypothetical protein Bca4012_049704 [Brassica carinata]|uniref:Uncharacterized protein n=1 Tax=Brassica carinata TaxID=52824 RepID=A0A8X7UIS0_BRACI|nr:hypothetical protein Bca52824_052455 [Brassica carinata]